MTSTYIVIAIIVFVLVAALVAMSSKYGKTSVLKKQAEDNLKARRESDNELEKLKVLPDDELDNELSEWVRDN